MADDEQAQEALADEAVTQPDTGAAEAEPKDDFKDLDAEQSDDEDGEGEKEEKKDEPEEKPKRPSGAQRAKWREQQLLSEISQRERVIEELQRNVPGQQAGAADEEKPPREEDFNGDFFKYQQAATAFEAGRAAKAAIKAEFDRRSATELSSQQQAIARERQAVHMERVDEAREVIADFDAVMDTMKGVNVRPDVIEEIMGSDKSALIAYHLAKNPEKLNALNNMSARELAREMGRLEGSVRMPASKKQTSAPPPLSAVRGGSNPSSPDRDLDAWLKKTYGRRA